MQGDIWIGVTGVRIVSQTLLLEQLVPLVPDGVKTLNELVSSVLLSARDLGLALLAGKRMLFGHFDLIFVDNIILGDGMSYLALSGLQESLCNQLVNSERFDNVLEVAFFADFVSSMLVDAILFDCLAFLAEAAAESLPQEHHKEVWIVVLVGLSFGQILAQLILL